MTDGAAGAMAALPPGLAADPAADLPEAMLTAHNAARARHGAAPLAWSPDLARYAQSVADRHKAEGCGGLRHSSALERRAVFGGGPVGENLGAGYASATAVVAGWLKEAADYDYGSGTSHGGPTGHFTQVVWRGTRAVGCGVAVCPDGRYKTVWACSYGPPGNVRGHYVDNVGRPDGG